MHVVIHSYFVKDLVNRKIITIDYILSKLINAELLGKIL